MKITLPLIRPALMVAVLFRTLDAFRIYDAAFIITRGANDTETVSILGYNQLVNRLNLGPRIGRRDPDLRLRDDHRVHLLPLPRREPGTEVTDHDRIHRNAEDPLGDRDRRRPVLRPDPGRLDHLAVAQGPDDDRRPEVLPDRSGRCDNYSAVFQGGLGFNHALVNSIGIAMITTLLALAFASMAAYAITRLDFPGKTLILAGALAISMFPAISIVGGLFNVWRVVGLYDTWPGLILPYLSFSLPLSIYIAVGVLPRDPVGPREGGADGRRDGRAGVPAGDPAAGDAGRVHRRHPRRSSSAWNDFLFANVLTSTDAARTAPVALSFFRGASQFTDPSGAIAAGAVVVTIPILIMVLIFQRRIVSGLTAGAVKG